MIKDEIIQTMEKPKGFAKIWREIKRPFRIFSRSRHASNCCHNVLADEAMEKMLENYSFNTVLDVGCGSGYHSKKFTQRGKKVTSLDYGISPSFLLNESDDVIISDFMKYDFKSRLFDAVWCSHVLEHQPNPNLFLRKIHSILREDGVLALTVPPLKHDIVGGHVSLFNGGILLYHLVLAGFDCSKAIVKKYGYNISIILNKKTVNVLPALVFDTGDIGTIRNFLPDKIDFIEYTGDVKFDGNIENINWT